MKFNFFSFLFSFSESVDEENLNEIYRRVLDVIDSEQAKPVVWIPTNDNI